MAFETQIKHLKSRSDKIEHYNKNEDDEVILFDKLLSEKRGDNIAKYYNKDYITALIAANTNIDFHIIKNSIDCNMQLFQKGRYKFLKSMCHSIEILLDTIDCEILIENLINNELPSGSMSLKKHFFKILGLKNYCDDIISFIRLFDLDIKGVNKCIDAIANMINLESTLELYYKSIRFQDKIITNKYTHDERIKKIRDSYEIDFRIEKVKPPYIEIYDYGYKVLKNSDKKEKKYKKALKTYSAIIKWLTENKNSKTIYDIPKELFKIDTDLQLEILREICKLNQTHYDNLTKEYEKLSKSNKKNITLIFKKFGLHISEEEITSSIDEDNLSNILSLLNKMKITNQRLVIKIVNEVPTSSIEKIYELLQTGTISNDFIIKNIDSILNSFTNFINNIELAIANDFSNSSIKAIENTLLEDNDKLKRNFDILKEYNLFDCKKITLCKNILHAQDLDVRIDKILELGYESMLLDNLYLLDIEPTLFKRLIVLRRLNIEITDFNQLHDILTNSKFIVKDNDLDSYIYTESIHKEALEDLSKNEFMTMLEEFKNTNRTYNFDGICISINKVKRNVNNIDNDILTNIDQISSIISNSYLDDIEYAKVINCLTAKNKQFHKS